MIEKFAALECQQIFRHGVVKLAAKNTYAPIIIVGSLGGAEMGRQSDGKSHKNSGGLQKRFQFFYYN